MIKLAILFRISLTMLSAFGQSASKDQVGTITSVKTHQEAGGGTRDAASYDVSAKVGETIYVVLYTPPMGEEAVKYAGGRQLLVGRRTIRYNDMLGQSFEVPIESQKSGPKPKPAKPASPVNDH